jgi:hypothetical protein
MKIKVVVHEAEEGAIGQRFLPYRGAPHKVKPSRSCSPTFMKPLKGVYHDSSIPPPVRPLSCLRPMMIASMA